MSSSAQQTTKKSKRTLYNVVLVFFFCKSRRHTVPRGEGGQAIPLQSRVSLMRCQTTFVLVTGTTYINPKITDSIGSAPNNNMTIWYWINDFCCNYFPLNHVVTSYYIGRPLNSRLEINISPYKLDDDNIFDYHCFRGRTVDIYDFNLVADCRLLEEVDWFYNWTEISYARRLPPPSATLDCASILLSFTVHV